MYCSGNLPTLILSNLKLMVNWKNYHILKAPLLYPKRRYTVLSTKSERDPTSQYVWQRMYREFHLLANLGWVDLDLGSSPGLVGRYCS